MKIYRLSVFRSCESGSLKEVLNYLSRYDTLEYADRDLISYPDTLEAGLQALCKYKTSIRVYTTDITGKYSGTMEFAALEVGEYDPDEFDTAEEEIDYYVNWELCEASPMPDHVSVPGEPYNRVWLNNTWFEPEYPDGIKAVIQGTSGQYYWFDDPDWDFDLERERCAYVFEADKAAGVHLCKHSHVYGDIAEDYVDDVQNDEEKYWAEYAKSGDWGDHYVVLYHHWNGSELVQFADVDIRPWQIVQNIHANRYVEGAEYYRI